MAERRLDTLLEGGSFFESPRWHDGRWWVSDFYRHNFGFDLMAGADPATAALTQVAPDGAASVAADGLLFPNGSVITQDGRTLIVGETAGARYTAFTIQDDGTLTDRRVWAQVAEAPPEGTDVFACMLGGDDGRTLLMCVAPDFLEHTRTGASDARLVTTTVDGPRAGLP
jgi:SMP-30/gluconolaconase/LRE-like protein